MRRPWLIALLCTLLLSLQQEALAHPLSHAAAPSKETVVGTADLESPCLECSLLAGGLDAAHAQIAVLSPAPPPPRVAFRSHRFRAGDVPAWFQSRAPPILL